MAQKIEVLYSCALCGIKDRPVQMRARSGDLKQWMDYMGHKLSIDHTKQSPFCRPKTFTEVKIPFDNGKRVGESIGDKQ